jgi:hypothetical protein
MIPDCPFCNEKLYSEGMLIYWCRKCHKEKFQINGHLSYYRVRQSVWVWKDVEYSQEQMDRISRLKAFL